MPSADELKELLSHTGCGKVALEKTADGWTVTLLDGAQLDLGGIAKGYAADLLRAQLEKEGVTSATLDLGGDVFVMGRKTDGSDWRIAVKDPADTESYLGIVSAADKFIVTSGVYERYFEENGVRYHHILDPKTGCPAESGLVSVTVLCKNAKAEDAYFVALRIRDKLAQIRLREYPKLRISASIGVAAADDSFESVATWIKAADTALYSAKDAGRDQIIDAGPSSHIPNSPATIPMPASKTSLNPVAQEQPVKDDLTY